MKKDIKAQLLVSLGAMLWGTTGLTQALAPENASSLSIGALRMAVGGGALLLMAFLKGTFKYISFINKKLLIMAALCMALYQPLFFNGLNKTGVALGTVLALGSAPIFSGVIELLSGKKIGKKWVISLVISIIGCICLFGGKMQRDINILGILFSLGAGLSYAVYVKISKELFEHGPMELINGGVFFLSGIILSPILLTQNIIWVLTIRGAIVVFHLGILTTALAYTIFAYGLIKIPTYKAVTLTLIEPLTAALLGVCILGEKLSVTSLLGVILLLFGLIINSLPYSGNIVSLSVDNSKN